VPIDAEARKANIEWEKGVKYRKTRTRDAAAAQPRDYNRPLFGSDAIAQFR